MNYGNHNDRGRRGLDCEQLRFAEVEPSDGEVRYVLEAIRTMSEPGARAELLEAISDAVFRQRNKGFTAFHWLATCELADLLVKSFGMDQRRAQLLAKENVFGSRRRAVLETTREYLERFQADAKRRPRRPLAERAERPPTPQNHSHPGQSPTTDGTSTRATQGQIHDGGPIVIHGRTDVPHAVAIAQSRKGTS